MKRYMKKTSRVSPDSCFLTPASYSRPAFTLIEMLVAMALTVVVMLILSECFILGLETFSGLKTIGDMQEELRTAVNLLRADLKEDHFEGKRRLSDPVGKFTGNWVLPPTTPASQVGTVPERVKEGFFAVGQSYPLVAPQKTLEGFDDGVSSYRAFDHWLHFSVKMRGNARERFFATALPPAWAPTTPQSSFVSSNGLAYTDAVFSDANSVRSAWAEIAYFLVKTGTTINPTSASGNLGTPLFALYRLQYVVLPDPADANARNLGYYPPSLSSVCAQDGRNPANFYGPNDLAFGWSKRAFNPYAYFPKLLTDIKQGKTRPISPNNVPYPATLVLSNVLSFQIQVITNPPAPGATPTNPNLPPEMRSNFGDQVPQNTVLSNTGDLMLPGNMPFDTANYVGGPPLPGSAATPPAPSFNVPGQQQPTSFSITGLQITIRIYDPKSRLTRQVTFIQDM